MPLLWVVPVLVTWFCPGPDALFAVLSCVPAATVIFFLQSWLSAAMMVCDLVGAALSQRRCPFFQELFCVATLVCMDGGLCVLPEVFDFIVISMSVAWSLRCPYGL